jgi:hypothetical protein
MKWMRAGEGTQRIQVTKLSLVDIQRNEVDESRSKAKYIQQFLHGKLNSGLRNYDASEQNMHQHIIRTQSTPATFHCTFWSNR